MCTGDCSVFKYWRDNLTVTKVTIGGRMRIFEFKMVFGRAKEPSVGEMNCGRRDCSRWV